MINPYLLDALAMREKRGRFALDRLYIPVLRGDGLTLECRKRFARRSHAEEWAIRARGRLIERYDALSKEPTA